MTNIHDVEQLEEQLSGPTPGQTGVAETGHCDDTMSGCLRGPRPRRIHHRHHNGCLMNVEPNILFIVHEGAPFCR
jgi:hypothetical protein